MAANWLSVVEWVAFGCSVLLALLYIHFIFFSLVGLFRKRTFPHTERKLRYGVIIPARNEESVVGNLIDSARANRYPQEQLEIFVIAHNCTDRTAQIARAHGATVYEYNNPAECTMGYAFRYLFDRIREDRGIDSFDGFFLFNADNILAADYFDRMNDAFVACGQRNVITSFRDSKNFGSNLMSACYGLYFMYGCRFESRGRTALGCSTRVQGTGYVIPAEIVRNGWQYVTLTEDWEFTADQILRGRKIVYCDDAVFYDEQPTSFRVMWRQRLRWARGHLLVCLSRFGDLVRGFFRPTSRGGTAHKGSVYDIFTNILPACFFGVLCWLLSMVASLLTPLLFPSADWSLADALLSWLRGCARAFIPSYLVLVVASVILYVAERRRIHNVSVGVRVGSVLVWPLFLALSVPAEICALFLRHLGWKAIPHTDTTSHADLNVAEETAAAGEVSAAGGETDDVPPSAEPAPAPQEQGDPV